ncbi:hypothetical protein GP924_26480 [Enterobacteriaceae bacterium 8376wB9]|nr:hypothetical protein [Enterobacteriaceae bacterium 8376wB9]
MKIINALIVVNTTENIMSGNITNNAYVVDNNSFIGSRGEGGATLRTVGWRADSMARRASKPAW